MNSVKFIVTFSVIILNILLTNEFSLRPKHFKIEHAASCKPPSRHGGKLERFDLTQPNKYQYTVDIDIRIFDDVTDPIQLHLKYSKCVLENEASACDEHETMKFDNVCDQFYEKNAPWTPLLNLIKPKLICPIKKGIYVVRNATLDLTMMSRLPIDGYRYVTTLSLFEVFKNGTRPLQLVCLDSDVVITLRTTGRRRNKG